MSPSRAVETLDRAWTAGRTSLSSRLGRLRSKSWHIGQCAFAAALSWYVARDVIGHPTPLFAPVVAVICLGTSYGQRLTRVVEMTLGVAIGVAIADVLLALIGTGAWQIAVMVVLAMSTTLLLNAGTLFVTQAAVQGIVVVTLVATPGYALTRWVDALVGGAVALLAASVVPQAPLRRPREQSALVVRRMAELLRAGAQSAADGDVDRAMSVLAAARDTDRLLEELRGAAGEGLSVIASSPFRRRHGSTVRRMAELVEPLDRAMRNTRVLVRRIAVTAYQDQPLPHCYIVLCHALADVVDQLGDVLAADSAAEVMRDPLIAVGAATSEVDLATDLSAVVVLAQIQFIVVDLLQLTGLDVMEATDAVPPRRG